MRLPVVKRLALTDGSVAITQLSYSPDSDWRRLNNCFLTAAQRQQMSSFGSVKRKLEFYYARLLLQPLHIQHTSTGRPVVDEGYVSISHARNTVVAAYSPTHAVGVDIAYCSEKVCRVKDKFLSSEEKQLFDTRDVHTLTLIWSIKETVYKMEDTPGLRFRDQIVVSSIERNGTVAVHKQGGTHRYTFDYLKQGDAVICYCHLGRQY